MESIKELLESEIKASEEFTRDNFGLKIGDGFPELVREVVKSDKMSSRMVMQLAVGAMAGKSVIDDIPQDPNEPWAPAILKNISVFELPLGLLYWGIQIGRKLQREEMHAMQRMSENPQQKKNENDHQD